MPPVNRPVKNLYYSLRRHFVDEFHLNHVPELTSGSRVLDLGGNRILKRGRFDIGLYDLEIVYANLSTAKSPDVQMDAAQVSFKDNSFDAVVCSELLEHVPDPPAVLRGVHRVLRKGGVLLICVPFLVPIHQDPGDYGRYTDSYWRETLGALGFVRVAIERQGSYWSVLLDLVRERLVFKLEEGPSPWGWIRHLLGRAVLELRDRALAWEARQSCSERRFYRDYTTGFGIVAHKG